jgi:hypothetical protein
MNETTQKTPAEKLAELEKERIAFMSKVEEEKKKFEDKRKKLILEEKERKRKEEQDWRGDLAKRLLNDYNIGCKEIAVMIVDRAWDSGHSYGYNEVTLKAEDLAEFIENVRKIDRSEN